MLGQFDLGSWGVPAGQQFEKYSDSFISLLEAGVVVGKICNYKLLSENFAAILVKRTRTNMNQSSM